MEIVLEYILPIEGQALDMPATNEAMIITLLGRRSTKIADMDSLFGPNENETKQILQIATRVPDHGKISPWRFIVMTGQKRREIGLQLAQIYKDKNPEMDENHFNAEAAKFERGHTIIVMISSPREHPKAPIWEQELSAGALGFSLILTCHGFGYAATWLSEWPMFDKDAGFVFGLRENERIAGFFYIGRPKTAPIERERPNIDKITEYWK